MCSLCRKQFIWRNHHESTHSQTHREFIIDFPKEVSQEKADEGWEKLTALLEDYKKAHNGQSVYSPTFIEDLEPAVKELQAEYGFTYTVETAK